MKSKLELRRIDMPTELPRFDSLHCINNFLMLYNTERLYLLQDDQNFGTLIESPSIDITRSRIFPCTHRLSFLNSDTIIATKVAYKPLHQILINIVNGKSQIETASTFVSSMPYFAMKRTLSVKKTSKVFYHSYYHLILGGNILKECD